MRTLDLATEFAVPVERLIAALRRAGAEINDEHSEVSVELEDKFRQFMARRGSSKAEPQAATVQVGVGVTVASEPAQQPAPSHRAGAVEGELMQRGTIKFVDGKSGKWGFLIDSDTGREIFFHVSDCREGTASTLVTGQAVEYGDIEENGRNPQAKYVRIVGLPSVSPNRVTPTNLQSRSPQSPRLGDSLVNWAFVPFIPFTHRDGDQYSSVLHLLATRTIKERWHLGSEESPQRPYTVLDSYLKYTFYRLQREDSRNRERKIVESASGRSAWAAFNTGLVDRLYEPIYALFERNERSKRQPWKFYDFCVPGQGPAGKKLTQYFNPLPEPAKYFNGTSDMLLDTSEKPHLDIPHIVLDGIQRDRYPAAFLADHTPAGFRWRDITLLSKHERKSYLSAYRDAVENDSRCYRDFKRRIEDATELALKRTRWNFKTAIPQYYPRFDEMSFLLPLAIHNDEVVDVALVISRNQSGSYQGSTVLPLDWAYKNARLVCRPDSDWLTPEEIGGNGEETEGDE